MYRAAADANTPPQVMLAAFCSIGVLGFAIWAAAHSDHEYLLLDGVTFLGSIEKVRV